MLVTKSSPPSGGGSEKKKKRNTVPCQKNNTADALTAEHPTYYGDRGSKTVKAFYRRVLYRAWGLSAHRGWARLMLDRRSLVQAPNAPRDQSQCPRARSDYDEETAYVSYMNPEPDFLSGPGGSVDAD